MGREHVGKDPWTGKKLYEPTINAPSELVPMAPAGSDASAYYLEQELRIFKDYAGCLLAFSSPEVQIIRLRNPPLPTWAS
eukprot:7847396-Alexandrium_andersonii.AAC.1